MTQISKFNQAILHFKNGAFALATSLCEQVLSSNPDNSDALNLLGLIAYRTNQPERALDLYRKAIKVNPLIAAYYSNLALTYQQLKQTEKALDYFNKAIALKSDFADAFFYRGNLFFELKQYEPAIGSYQKAVVLNSNFSDAYYGLGSAQQSLGRFAEAIESYKKVTEINPLHMAAQFNLGLLYQTISNFNLALECFNKVVLVNSDNADAYNNIGVILMRLGQFDEALNNLENALFLNPDYAEAYFNKALVFDHRQLLEQALVMYDKALSLKFDYFEAYFNKGNLLKKLAKLHDSLACYDILLKLRPNLAEGHFARGNVLYELNKLDEACSAYDNALLFKPNYAEAYHNRGFTLVMSRQFERGIADYEKALSIKPDYEFLLGLYLNAKMMLCDWRSLSEYLQRLENDIALNKKASVPFALLALLERPDLHKLAASVYADKQYPEVKSKVSFARPATNGKIRIGYYSADFYAHATAFLMAELFEEHDKDKFEIYGFSYGPDLQDAMRERLASAFDNIFNVRDKTDEYVANLSRELGIDIAIDLKGYTQNARTGIFAQKCAPVQVNYLGYPGTMGSSYYDYVIADKIVIPPHSQSDYTEKVVYLPCSYQVNDSKRKISTKIFTRHDQGLPESGFVFCCFNNNYKILPATFDLWMSILKEVEGSVLWLLEDNATAGVNLRKEAEARGVSSDSLVFAKRAQLEDHLARHQLADLFLDTLPYNAHTTASDALWAGVPLLTQTGKSFASRVAASLLTYLDMPELIVNSDAEYLQTAVRLAKNLAQLRKLKVKLAKNKKSSSLFNSKVFARYVESAYFAMQARRAAGLLPDMIEINP
jgi:predicted O-linked N-acetylglucosamine transferase (SPINDLY family)